MKSLRVLITAGPTREMLDPVRFLSNVSTGEMGYQLARAARKKGWRVTLVSGPTALPRPKGIRFVSVVSAGEMERAVKLYFPKHDVLIMTAAVCDYTPLQRSRQKIKRVHRKTVHFKRTGDILKSVTAHKGNRFVVGFCLETEDLVQNAIRKLRGKRLDLMVANQYDVRHNPFGRNKASVLLIDRSLRRTVLPHFSKKQIARRLLDLISRRTEAG